VTDEEVLAFVQASIPSVWALELLLLVRRDPNREWRADALVRELRSTDTVVQDAVAALQSAGMVVGQDELYRFQPASPALETLVAETAKIYAIKPVSVIRAIVTAPNDKLRTFANSFKLKE
jgi:hypothetical protein